MSIPLLLPGQNFSLPAGERGRSLFPLPLFDLPAGPLGQLQAGGSGDSQQGAACGQLLFQVHNQYVSFSVRYAFSPLMGMRTCTPRSGAAQGPRSDSCWRGMNPPQRKILAAPKCLHAAARRIMEQVRRNPPHNQYVSFSVRYAFSSLMGMRTCTPRSGAAQGPRSDSCWRGMNPPQRKILAAPKCLHAAARRIMEQVRRNPPHNQYASFSVRYAFSSLMGMRTCSMVSRSRTVTHRSPGFSPSPTVSKSTVMQKGVPISSSRR